MNEAELRRIVEASPLKAHAGEIMALARPAVKMNTCLVAADDLPLGASRMGGAPDLPPGAPWPENRGRPVEFLAQIDFAAAAEAYRLPGFPDSGWVALFRDLKTAYEGDYDDDGQWRWLHFDCSPDMLVRTAHPGKPEATFNFCEVAFKPELCLPGDITDRFETGDDAADEDAYEYFDNALWDMSRGPFHRIGGPPMLIQSDEGDYAGWELLMQIDSDDEVGWMWGDMGRIYYWAQRHPAQPAVGDRTIPPLERHFSAMFAEEEFY